MSRLRAPSNEEVNASSNRTTQVDLQDLDQLAGEVRDAGQLSEPLADSVLENSLRRLRPTGNVQSRAMQELEDPTPLHQLDQLMEEDDLRDPHTLTTSVADLRGEQTMQIGRMQDNHYAPLTGSMSSGLEDWMSTSQIPAPQAYPWDLWGLGWDTLQQSNLPYDHMLGFNGTL